MNALQRGRILGVYPDAKKEELNIEENDISKKQGDSAKKKK